MFTTARTAFCTLSVVSMMLPACGSQPQAAQRDQPEPVASIAPANEPAPANDPAPTAEELAAADSPPMDSPERDPQTADRTNDEPANVSPALAELGRPDWWFTGIERSDRSIRLCAEAGGPTVREARRAAIDAARKRLALEVEIDPMRENVSLATVLPLPAASAGPGAAKYIGYVMMEVPAS